MITNNALMNNNIPHFCAVSYTFPSRAVQILRLQSAPAGPVPACGGPGLFGGNEWGSTRQEGCLALLICVCRCICRAHRISESFSYRSGKRAVEGLCRGLGQMSNEWKARLEPGSLGSGLLSHIFFPFTFPLSLWIAIVCLQISTATRA